jgi:hypothetical protein
VVGHPPEIISPKSRPRPSPAWAMKYRFNQSAP